MNFRTPGLFSVLLYICFSKIRAEFTHGTVLDSDGKFHVFWGPTDGVAQDITFKVEVEAHGYVGFGLSPKGGMAGSDIVTGWVKDGQVFFQDRHATTNGFPPIDADQNWELLSGSENDTHTTLTFRRKWNTCDKEDFPIDDSTIRLIYAYTEEDPESVENIQYHRFNRGARSTMLLQTKDDQTFDKSELSYWDVRSPNYTITSEHSSMYWCSIHKTPDIDTKHHIVRVQPIIDEDHERFVHHIVMYECVGAEEVDYKPYLSHEGHECYHPNMPNVMWACDGVFAAWGVGGQDLVLPEHVGWPMEPTPGKYYLLEMHYDNPSLHGGIIDQSGFRIYYTPKLRKYDGGTLMIGATISPRMLVPPGREKYVIAGHSNPECLGPDMPTDGIKVLGVLLHSHLLGRHLKARHIRNSTELKPLADDMNYDFNYQEYRYFSEEATIMPQDQITVECTYDSRDRGNTTFGGQRTREEMCLAFLLYYPRIEKFASLSVPTNDLINKYLGANLTGSYRSLLEFKENMTTYDWNTVDVDEVEKAFRYSTHDTHCYLGNGEKNSVQSKIAYPIFLPYISKAPSCDKNESPPVTNVTDESGVDTCQNNNLLLFVALTMSYFLALII